MRSPIVPTSFVSSLLKQSFLALYLMSLLSWSAGFAQAQNTIPKPLVNGDIADAADLNANFQMILDSLMPIGAIIPWHKNAKTGLTLSDRWVECNGQTISSGPLAGVTVPNLNGEERFLRGSTESGVKQEAALPSHQHQVVLGAHQHQFDVSVPGTHSTWVPYGGSHESGNSKPWITYPTDLGTKTTNSAGGVGDESEVRPKNMSVVYIMRIK